MSPDYIPQLQKVIRQTHGVESQHSDTAPVREEFQGKVLWEGFVETFRILGHPEAKQAYAWAYVDEANTTQFVAILGKEPISTPQKAVKAFIAYRLKATSSGVGKK